MDPITTNILLGLGIIGLGAAVFGLLKQSGRSALNAHFTVTPNPATLRGKVQFQISANPRSPVTVNRVVARTRCLRQTTELADNDDDSGSLGWESMASSVFERVAVETMVQNEEIGRSEMEVCGTERWDALRPRTWNIEIPLADGLPTKEQGKIHIHWVAEVHFEISAVPDVTLSQHFRVHRAFGG